MVFPFATVNNVINTISNNHAFQSVNAQLTSDRPARSAGNDARPRRSRDGRTPTYGFCSTLRQLGEVAQRHYATSRTGADAERNSNGNTWVAGTALPYRNPCA